MWSVDEVVEPLRFEAYKLKCFQNSSITVDFITMYPEIEQKMLLRNVFEAIQEAWEFEESRIESGILKNPNDGSCCLDFHWVHISHFSLKHHQSFLGWGGTIWFLIWSQNPLYFFVGTFFLFFP